MNKSRRTSRVPARTKVRLCAEGWYYLFVVGFITGGAVLREVNLLVLLAGMMLGPLIFNWLYTGWSLQRIRASRLHGRRAAADEPMTVRTTLFNDRSYIPSWAVTCETRVSRVGSDQSTLTRVMVPTVWPGQSAGAECRVRIAERGAYELSPPTLVTRFPLGLVKARTTVGEASQFLVWPRQGQLTMQWRRLLQKAQQGNRQSHPRKGFVDGDYYGLREWRAGDSRKWIHWRTSARLNELTVLQFEQQRDDDLILLVDLWRPEDADDSWNERIERVLRFAATAVAQRCRQGGTQLRLALGGTAYKTWNAPSSQSLSMQVLDEMACVQGGEWGTCNEAIQLADSCGGDGFRRIVVLSTRNPEGLDTSQHSREQVLWIGPDDMHQWFVDTTAEATSSSDKAERQPDAAEPQAKQPAEPVAQEAGV